MTLRAAWLLPFVFCACIDSKPSYTVLPGSTLSFQPSEYTLTMGETQCDGITQGPYYSLDVVGNPAVAPRAGFTLGFEPPMPQGKPLPVTLEPLMSGAVPSDGLHQDGLFQGSDSFFAWEQGANPNELDPTAATSVDVTIDHIPSGTDDDGVFTVDMQFMDGGIYYVRITAPQATDVGGCSAG